MNPLKELNEVAKEGIPGWPYTSIVLIAIIGSIAAVTLSPLFEARDNAIKPPMTVQSAAQAKSGPWEEFQTKDAPKKPIAELLKLLLSIPSGAALIWMLLEVFSIPMGILRLLSRNIGYRFLLGAVWWLGNISALAVAVMLFYGLWNDFREWAMVALWIGALFIAAPLHRLNFNLQIFADACFESPSVNDRLKYVRAARELKGIAKPIIAEVFLAQKQAQRNAIQQQAGKRSVIAVHSVN